MKKLGQRIVTQRELLGLSQAELAKMLDMKQQRLGLIEKGGGTPTIEQLSKMTKLFNCSYEYLIDGFDSSNKNIERIKFLAAEIKKTASKL